MLTEELERRRDRLGWMPSCDGVLTARSFRRSSCALTTAYWVGSFVKGWQASRAMKRANMEHSKVPEPTHALCMPLTARIDASLLSVPFLFFSSQKR